MSNRHQIFVNLPVQDLQRSMDFFRTLGYSFNEEFTDDKGACLVLGDDIFVMLLVDPFFKGFITTEVADTDRTAEVIVALSVDDRASVDALVDQALSSGGSPSKEPSDMGFMYSRSFRDPDGHHWEVFQMDQSQAE